MSLAKDNLGNHIATQDLIMSNHDITGAYSVAGAGSLLFSGNVASIPATGAGSRMMWYPLKSSFRAGGVSNAQWDNDNIGFYSFAAGFDATAKGNYSVAMGTGSTANSDFSIAMGRRAATYDIDAVAIGYGTGSSGKGSTALGYNSTINSGADYTVVIGSGAASNASGAVAIGGYIGANATNSIAIGVGTYVNGLGDHEYLSNDTPNSFLVGFSTYPSLFVTQNAVSVNNTRTTTGFNVNKINFADGTSMITAASGSGGGDSLGSHIATMTLNMNGNNITNAGAGRYNVNQQFVDIAASTNSLTASLNQVKSDTGTIRTDLSQVKSDTGTIRTDLTQVKTDTGTLRTDLAQVKLDTGTLRSDFAQLALSTGVLRTDINQVKADTGTLRTDLSQVKTDTGTLRTDIAQVKLDTGTLRSDFAQLALSTGVLRTDINQVKSDTGTIRTDLSVLAISTGTLIKKSGDTMTGVLNVSTLSFVARINFVDGTIMTSTTEFSGAGAGASDSLGSHIATMTLNMSNYPIVNISSMSGVGGGLLFKDDLSLGIPIEGAGVRMMWYPDKRSFRAGEVDGTQWDDVNIGATSFAAGNNTRASGNYSVALNNGTVASSNNSLAAGLNTTASGPQATALGNATTALGNSSTALGYTTNASGTYSLAAGDNSTASGTDSVAIGKWVTAGGAANAIAIGLGTAGGNLINNTAQTLMVGFNRTVPTLFVSSASVSVDSTDMTAGLNVSTINAVARLKFSDGTIMTSTKNFSGASGGSDSLGSHIATMTLNMANYPIINISTVSTSKLVVGSSVTLSGTATMAAGKWVSATADDSFVFGQGLSNASRLINSTPKTFMVGFDNTAPTFTVFTASVAIDGNGIGGDYFQIFDTQSNKIFRVDNTGATFADGAYSGTGADYAEWFEKEAELVPGDLVGLNAVTMKARKYVAGDVLLGVCSDRPGFIGDRDMNKTEVEIKLHYVLVGLVGKVMVDPAQIAMNGIKVETLDGKQVGYMLGDGRVLLRIKD
jgi:hypothetical protein